MLSIVAQKEFSSLYSQAYTECCCNLYLSLCPKAESTIKCFVVYLNEPERLGCANGHRMVLVKEGGLWASVPLTKRNNFFL